ncbi:hypothetical protein PMAYCL1PPCAC_19681, partial [Pristionchus mayeri]
RYSDAISIAESTIFLAMVLENAQNYPSFMHKQWTIDLYLQYDTDGFAIRKRWIYSLTGLIAHSGDSSDSGHYIAFTKIGKDRWAKCDDSYISLVHDNEIINLPGGVDGAEAYVLFYEKCQTEKEESKVKEGEVKKGEKNDSTKFCPLVVQGEGEDDNKNEDQSNRCRLKRQNAMKRKVIPRIKRRR